MWVILTSLGTRSFNSVVVASYFNVHFADGCINKSINNIIITITSAPDVEEDDDNTATLMVRNNKDDDDDSLVSVSDTMVIRPTGDNDDDDDGDDGTMFIHNHTDRVTVDDTVKRNIAGVGKQPPQINKEDK